MSNPSIATETGISQSNKSAFRNPWVLGWLALVLLVLAVNIGMVTTAVVTNPGLVDKDYYEKGRDYERHLLTQMAAKSALGWKVQLDPPERIVMSKPDTFRFTALDSAGRPLTHAKVEAKAYRPSDADADFSAVLSETSPGHYEGPISFKLKGIWELTLIITLGEHSYDISRRIIVNAN